MDGDIAGIGRVVGDNSIVCILTDICVKSKFQGIGIGSMIVRKLKQLIENNVKPGEKMQVELTPTAEMKNSMRRQDLSTKKKKLQECIYR